jgi:hypothetical protein
VNGALRLIEKDAFPLGRLEPRSVAYSSSSIADWFALNSNELTWITLVTVGVIAIGMLM